MKVPQSKYLLLSGAKSLDRDVIRRPIGKEPKLNIVLNLP